MLTCIQWPETPTPALAEAISDNLKRWFQINKRDLPWRGADPYGVWVSEIMLQQTQVIVVIDYYNRFMKRFPNIESLAQADITDVLRIWSGLGYYSRARCLHQTARAVVELYGGSFPSDKKSVLSLPGIGRYTAGAVLSIAFNRPEALVDANVTRVLSRVFGVQGDPKSSDNISAIWSLAESLVPKSEPGNYNQALMELGALVCLPSDPKCGMCPIKQYCFAGNTSNPVQFPELVERKNVVHVSHSAAIIHGGDNSYWLIRRPESGLWGGLWEFPRVVCNPGETPMEGAERAAYEVLGWKVDAEQRVALVKHTVTHYQIALHGVIVSPRMRKPWSIPQGITARCVPLSEMEKYPCAAPQTKLRKALEHRFYNHHQQTTLPLEPLYLEEAK